MKRFLDTLRNYAELGRISNLPTTFTNVLVGCAAGAMNGLEPFPWRHVIGVMIAIACFYIAGMALNDVVDSAIDKIERPKRPIPSGRISRIAAIWLVITLVGIGLNVLALISEQALAMGACLVASIVLYDLVHAKLPGSVIIMGLCRGLVYVTAAASMGWPLEWKTLGVLAASLALYVILLTIVSRSENQQQLDRRKWLAIVLPIVALAPVAFIHVAPIAWILAPILMVVAWLSRTVMFVFSSLPRTRNAVMAWLSGICLVDGLYLSLLNQPMLALAAMACFIITVLGQRRILGT